MTESRYANRRMEAFTTYAGMYDTGQFSGHEGWEKLRYALKMRADLDGATGALMSRIIRASDVEPLNKLDRECRKQRRETLQNMEGLRQEAAVLSRRLTAMPAELATHRAQHRRPSQRPRGKGQRKRPRRGFAQRRHFE